MIGRIMAFEVKPSGEMRTCPGLVVAGWTAAFAVSAWVADFGSPGGPPPANVEAVAATLRQDPNDLELLISFGTSKGGSAGHLALAIRDTPGQEIVYSANFYADRNPEHARDFYVDELMVRYPEMEYLFGTSSSLGSKAALGLDFGEVYKRSVVGIRSMASRRGRRRHCAPTSSA